MLVSEFSNKSVTVFQGYCLYCGAWITQQSNCHRGGSRFYCSNAHKQKACRQRKKNQNDNKKG